MFPSPGSALVTLGSDLSKPPIASWGCGGDPCTGVQLSLAGRTTVSPVNGTITVWRVRGATGTDTGRLKVLRPNPGSGSYTFTAVSTTRTVPGGTGISTFTTSLPIIAGDLIGLDDDHLGSENFGDAGGATGTELVFQPEPLGGTPVTPAFNGVGELLFNADVNPIAIIPQPRKPKPGKGGTAVLTISAPNPGVLDVGTASAKGAAAAATKKGFVKPVTKLVAAAGDVKMRLRPTKSTKSILRRRGRANGKIEITFTPTGGSPSSRLLKVRLRLS